MKKSLFFTYLALPIVSVLALFAPKPAFTDGGAKERFTTDNTWMRVSAFLVFILHLGLATVESGLTQAKNTTPILKNTARPSPLAYPSFVFLMYFFNI